MFAASMEAPSYGASKLPAVRHPTQTNIIRNQIRLPVLDPPSLFRLVVVIRALVTFAIVSVFRDRAQD
jgi:hypothetical protein